MRSNKYKAKKVKRDGMVFDSKKEYERYLYLKDKESRGDITDLQRQVAFELIPSQRGEDGKVIERPAKYIADFTYKVDGVMIVEDTKGLKLPEYVLKRKLMLWIKKIRIREV